MSLNLFDELSSKAIAVNLLQGFALLAKQQKEHLRAACLFGANKALRESLVGPPMTREHILAVQQFKEFSTSNGELESAWNKGQEMTLDQAIKYALED